MHAAHRRDLANLLFAVGLAWGLASAGHASAAPAGAPPDSTTTLGGPHGVGSLGHPIPVPATETRSLRAAPPAPRRSIRFSTGPLRLSVFAIDSQTHPAPAGVDAVHTPLGPLESRVYMGGGFEFALDHTGIFFGGERLAVRDPLDLLGLTRDESDHWVSSAGFEIHF